MLAQSYRGAAATFGRGPRNKPSRVYVHTVQALRPGFDLDGTKSMKLKRVVWWTAAAIPIALIGAASIAYLRSGNACDDPRTFKPANGMKAIVYCEYGAAEVLRMERIEKPTPTDTQILVKVRAGALNPLDWHVMRGIPYAGRVAMGLRKPADILMGADFAGVVEAVGTNVTQFAPGDEVFGGRGGALAEYVTIRQDSAVVSKPANVTFEQAGSVAVAAVTALQGLRDHGRVKAGEKVLINGASGGVGTFAVQIAKALGAEVTGVCSTRNVELVRSLGADHVIDYTKEDFATRPEKYDVVIDNVANHSLAEYRRILNPDGRYVLIGGGGLNDHRVIGPFGRVIAAFLISPFIDQEMGFFIATLNKADMTFLGDLMKAGKMTPVIDRQYPFNEVAAAITYLEQGRARGKVVITLE
jgi:NADPH:quinone reductase-like Zn-dependent oxidoreductase